MAEVPEEDLAARRATFLSAGRAYDEVRPSYPQQAVRWIMGAGVQTVVDLGCGTGKLTAQLVAIGHHVVGVDPSMTMLRGLVGKGLSAVCGNAEAIPLKSGCADVVTAAQAFHWFELKRALPEIRRILRGAGHLGLVWNLRDESVEWVRQLSRIVGSDDALGATLGTADEFIATIIRKLTQGGLFGSVEHAVFDHAQELNEDRLVSLVASRSYVVILPDGEKKDLLSRVRQLCQEHPQLRGRGTFLLPYRTRAFRATVSY